MNRGNSYYREQRRRTIRRKEGILRRIGGEAYVYAWAHGATKGKIHCSCWMCRKKSYDDPQLRDKWLATDAAEQLRKIE